MSAASDYLENAVLALLFNNSNIANLGDATGVRGSTTAGSIWVALYTAAPSDTGGGTEANYTGYARVAVARSGAGWTVSGTSPTQVVNASAVTFGACTAGSNTITHFGLFDASTSGNLLVYGALSASLSVSAGITPQFASGQLNIQLA